MELRQLRYFVRSVELRSISRAAADLQVVTSALSQQISRLESELSTVLLQRSVQGVEPTAAGRAFFREAKLALRHVDQGRRAAQELRVSGEVNIGLTPTVIGMIGLDFLNRMRDRYTGVQVHLVEGMSGYLANLLSARELDHAVLFRYDVQKYWTVSPLMVERIQVFSAAVDGKGGPAEPVALADLASKPLLLATRAHGLRQTLDSAFAQARVRPSIAAEIDSLPTLMDAVASGMGQTLQPWAACARYPDPERRFVWSELRDVDLTRSGDLCSLQEEQLSSAALAARGVLVECVRDKIAAGHWHGARIAGTVDELAHAPARQ
jgi:LysR family tcuABC transcriptional regulator